MLFLTVNGKRIYAIFIYLQPLMWKITTVKCPAEGAIHASYKYFFLLLSAKLNILA